MNKIGWCSMTVNPVQGWCPNTECPVYGDCYGHDFYRRFGRDRTIRMEKKRLEAIASKRIPQRVFVGSTMELFGPWVPDDWMRDIIERCRIMSQHTFLFLTKRPRELQAFNRFNPWPSNCWVGVTAINNSDWIKNVGWMANVEASVRFVSLEPLLGSVCYANVRRGRQMGGIDWLIIGAMTGKRRRECAPKKEWVEEILTAADRAGVPVFLKDNLQWPTVRREWPKDVPEKGEK